MSAPVSEAFPEELQSPMYVGSPGMPVSYKIFQKILRADLHGTIFSYDCCMRLLQRALLTSSKDHIQLVIVTF